MKFKFRYVLIVGIILAFGSCVAKKPEQPATVIQMEAPSSAPSVDPTATEAEQVIDEAQAEDDGQLMAYQEYSEKYLSALAATGDIAEAEWNTFIVCRAASIAKAAQVDADANNTGLQAELIKRLRAVNTDAKARAAGKRFYAHDAAGAGDFKDPAPDVQALVMLLQAMQDERPNIPLCTQNAGSLWREVDRILAAADDMARTDPQTVPVRVPREVANDPD